MALVCVFLALILGVTVAIPQGQDMNGKMLVFPEETDTAHVRLTASKQNLAAVTVCLRYFTELSRPTTFFSLATQSLDNAFLIDKIAVGNQIDVTVKNVVTNFKGQNFQINRWQPVCATWDSVSGLTQMWLDGKHSSMKYSTTSNINGPMIIVLGQEQDSYGGRFDRTQSFVGMMSDVHMWDYVLSSQQIRDYSQKKSFPEGNVINWMSLQYEKTGRVVTHPMQ